MSGITVPAWQAEEHRYLKPEERWRYGGALRGYRGMGLTAAFAMVLLAATTAVISDGIGSLFCLGGLVIVFGGVTASAFMTFRSEDVVAAVGSVVATLDAAPGGADGSLRRDVEDMVGWARVAGTQGLRALEQNAGRKGGRDRFVSYGLALVVSGYAPEDVRAMLQIAADGNYEREHVQVDVLSTMASHAPAFGMVGTLIGMIAMLRDIGGETGAVGSMLAVAFLSTLYGVLSARMIYMPAAARLERQVEARRLRDTMLTEGMVMLAGRKSGTAIRDRLNAFLHPQARSHFDVIDAIENAVERGSDGADPRGAADRAGPQRMLRSIGE